MFAVCLLLLWGGAAQSLDLLDEEDALSLLQIHSGLQRNTDMRPSDMRPSDNSDSVDLGRDEPMKWPEEVQYPTIDVPVPIRIFVWSFAGFMPNTHTSKLGNCTVDYGGRDFKMHIPPADYDISEADVVVFGLPNMVFGFPKNYIMPRVKSAGQMWVSTCEEPYKRSGTMSDCRLMHDPATMQMMDATSSYSMTSDIPVLIDSVYVDDLRISPPDFTARPTTELATIATSDCTSEWRNSWFEDMMAEINGTGHSVLSYGRCMHNAEEPHSAGAPEHSQHGWIDRSAARPFKLVAENTLQPWYVTEKIWDALAEGSVPVYYGPPEVKQMMPEGSFIYAKDFPSTKALVQKMLSFTPAEFAKAQAWRQKPTSEWGMWEQTWTLGRHTMMNRFCEYAAKQKLAGTPFKSGKTPSPHDLPCCPADPLCCMNQNAHANVSSASSAA